MQVTTLGAQLDLASELTDWYRYATSVPFGYLLIDLSPRTDNRLRYCTNSGSVPSKFYILPKAKIFLHSKCSNRFPANAKTIFFSLAQKFLSGFYADAW